MDPISPGNLHLQPDVMIMMRWVAVERFNSDLILDVYVAELAMYINLNLTLVYDMDFQKGLCLILTS